jgi:ABC-type antimicrobial peptide transport system permease subunit
MKWYILFFLIGAMMTVFGFIYSVRDLPAAGISAMFALLVAFFGQVLSARRAEAHRS